MTFAPATQFYVYLLSELSSGTYHLFNVKVLVGTFNQEKAQVGAFSVIVKTDCETDGSFYSTNPQLLCRGQLRCGSSQL